MAKEVQVEASPLAWAYRNRIRLHVEGNRAVGFKALRSHDLAEIGYCMIADPAINAELHSARALVTSLDLPIREIELVAAGEGRVVFILKAGVSRAATAAEKGCVSTFLTESPGVAGVVLKQRRRSDHFGDTSTLWNGKHGKQPAEVFSQVNWPANRLLVESLLGMAELTGRERVLELYCGAGNLSLPLAQRAASLTAVDENPEAISAARSNAKVNRLVNIRFKVGDAASELKSSKSRGYDLVILDPPRTGAPQAVEAIARRAIPRVIYISCDPSTLARDAARLQRVGYEIKRVAGVDLFPQTYHMEALLSAVYRG